MAKKDRGNVWLGVSGMVENTKGEWLVVQKRYGGLHGKWSFPAGFVEGNETVDEAIVREIKEETGISTKIEEMIGFRSGVLRHEISDNMAIFRLSPLNDNEMIVPEKAELYDVRWIHPEDLLNMPEASLLLQEYATKELHVGMKGVDTFNPGDQFGYTRYKVFF